MPRCNTQSEMQEQKIPSFFSITRSPVFLSPVASSQADTL
jgi:hypothetical protein